MSEAEFLHHSACSSCGSSDARAIYSDGGEHCFACGSHKHGDDKEMEDNGQETEGRPRGLLLPLGSCPAWRSRGLTAESCRKWRLGVADGPQGKVRVFEYRNSKASPVAQKLRPRSKKDMRFVGEPSEAGLYGQHLWGSGGKMVVVTEGEIDAVSISQVQGHKWPVVSVPNGAQGARKALQKNLEWLSSFETVVLWFDDDDPGRAAAEECAPLFRPGSCRIATLAPHKDANEALVAGKQKEIITAIWQAKVWRPDGIVSGLDLWETISRPKEVFALSYPWEGLQTKTQGIRPGEVVTLTAGSGIGKSAVVRELAHHLLTQSQETVGMMMFEETVARTALGLMSIEMNQNLTLMSNPEKLDGFRDAYDSSVGSGRLILYDHFGSTDFGNVLARARYMASALDVRYLFLDHLSILVSGMADGDERRLIDNAMTSIKTLAMETGLGIFLVSHLKRPEKRGHEEGATTSLSQLRGSHAIAQLSDIVVGLERNQQDVERADITTLRVLKNRWTGDTGTAGCLRYDRETGRLHETLEETFDGF